MCVWHKHDFSVDFVKTQFLVEMQFGWSTCRAAWQREIFSNLTPEARSWRREASSGLVQHLEIIQITMLLQASTPQSRKDMKHGANCAWLFMEVFEFRVWIFPGYKTALVYLAVLKRGNRYEIGTILNVEANTHCLSGTLDFLVDHYYQQEITQPALPQVQDNVCA